MTVLELALGLASGFSFLLALVAYMFSLGQQLSGQGLALLEGLSAWGIFLGAGLGIAFFVVFF